MKIALCFLTYKNLSQNIFWKNLIKDNLDKYSIFIHNKYEFDDKNDFFYKYCLNNKIKTEWGTISLVKATLLLFKEAIKDKNNEFFVLLSDKCIPLYNLDYIYKSIFKINNNIISSYDRNKERFNFMNNKEFISKENFKKQHQWMILNRNTVIFFLENNFLEDFGDNFYIPDEHYFINVINKYNIMYLNKLITYTNWNEPSDLEIYKKFPKTYTKISKKLIKKIREYNNYFFIRKIGSECNLKNLYSIY